MYLVFLLALVMEQEACALELQPAVVVQGHHSAKRLQMRSVCVRECLEHIRNPVPLGVCYIIASYMSNWQPCVFIESEGGFLSWFKPTWDTLTFTPQGLIAGTSSGSLHVFSGNNSTTPWHVVKKVKAHGSVADVVSSSLHNTIIISAGATRWWGDGNIKIWNKKCEKIRSLHDNLANPTALCLLSNGTLISGNEQGHLFEWDIEQHKATRIGCRREVLFITQLGDNVVISSHRGDGLCFWDLRTNELLGSQEVLGYYHQKCLDVIDCYKFAMCHWSLVMICDIRKGFGATFLDSFREPLVQSIGMISPTELLCGTFNGSVKIWDISQSIPQRTYVFPASRGRRLSALAADPHKKRFAVATYKRESCIPLYMEYFRKDYSPDITMWN